MTKEEMLAKIAELEKQVTEQKNGKSLSFKVSEKGALSVYGMGRFPVTLYVEQWERLINAVPAIQDFMTANIASLTRKDRT